MHLDDLSLVVRGRTLDLSIRCITTTRCHSCNYGWGSRVACTAPTRHHEASSDSGDKESNMNVRLDFNGYCQGLGSGETNCNVKTERKGLVRARKTDRLKFVPIGIHVTLFAQVFYVVDTLQVLRIWLCLAHNPPTRCRPPKIRRIQYMVYLCT